jgi:Beta-ketoacyl synthase, N-terminal domain
LQPAVWAANVIRVYVEGIGLCGPGLDRWDNSRPVLAGRQIYQRAEPRVPPDGLLPPNERRRAVQTVKIALAAGAEAFSTAQRDPAVTPTVFASSGGDGATLHDILTVLASADRAISPTRFHNSVQNAPAGYWSIATGSRAASSSLSCHDDSFAAGLLEAAVQAVTGLEAVALIAYDVPYPAPLSQARRIGSAFGVALVLSPLPTAPSFACIEITLGSRSEASTLAPPELEALRQNTPSARSLPMLAALARAAVADVTLSYLDDMVLALHISPVVEGAYNHYAR